MRGVIDTANVAQETAVPPGAVRHLGVILDGNRRWARNHRLPIEDMYQAGAAKVPEFLTWCERAQIPIVSMWALSVDNLRRSQRELAPLLDIIVERLRRMAARYPWRLRIIGRLDLLPEKVAAQLCEIERVTATAPGLLANIAVAYDGREDVLSAIQGIIASGPPSYLDTGTLERLLTEHLSTAGLPDPDLIIRTSGEIRTSGFLLWQGAQSELYFTPTPWPDLEERDLRDALVAYRTRHRRFGS